jgi:hypothetical protein
MASFIYLMWDKRLEYLTSHPATAVVGLGVMGALAHLQWNVSYIFGFLTILEYEHRIRRLVDVVCY